MREQTDIMAQKVITVFGGGGFIGRYVVQALLRTGAQVRVAERGPKNAWASKAQANLGQIAFVPADITRPETLGPAVTGADAVINLVGRFDDMDAVHVAGARNVAEAAAKAGVAQLVHLSAIGADPASASAYGRTKGEGEAAVRAAFPAATMLRPSVVFGREDQFINRFANLIRMMPVTPVLGAAATLQPVFVGDVAKAAVAALSHPGETFELGGPEVYTMAALNRWIAARTGRDPLFVELPDALCGLIAALPGTPISRDQWAMLQSPNIVAEGAPGLAELGIQPTPLDLVAEGWLVEYRRHGRFGAAA
jgi:uncharacterized protein YbjT (DUF2867 family)